MRKFAHLRIAIGVLFAFHLVGCAKIELKTVEEPAYIRVFNNLHLKATLDNTEGALSTLTMLINPDFGADGLPIGAEMVGDFLVPRDSYAPPYPEHIGNSVNVFNPEYPGKEHVVPGPILNGYDLSSWAQVHAADIHIVFYTRPKTETPFFELDSRYRSNPLVDTIIHLDQQEVYTLHVLQKDFNTKETGLLVRQEVFPKLPLADSLVYVNFYNMSAKGFWRAPLYEKPYEGTEVKFLQDPYSIRHGIRDTMNVYYSLMQNGSPLPSQDMVPVQQLIRNTETAPVSPYQALSLFVDKKKGQVVSDLYQNFRFVYPGYTGDVYDPAKGDDMALSMYKPISCYQNGKEEIGVPLANTLPNLIVSTHSGKDNPRSFGTLNTIEVVNGYVHLTTVQRVYAPPIY